MRFTNKCTIQTSTRQAFKQVTTPSYMVNWMKDFKAFKGRFRDKIGNKGLLIFEDGEGQLELKETILSYEKPTLFAHELRHTNFVSKVTYSFKAISDSETEIIVKNKIKLKPLPMRLLEPFMRFPMKKQQKEDLLRLQKQNRS